MTLILNYLTKEYAIQVSDRRLTFPDGRLGDDDANKAVLFCGRMSFSYTGLAQLGSERTDLWIAKILKDPSCLLPSDAAKVIRAKATEYFQQHKVYIRHAFVGVGWAEFSQGKPLTPVICLISNFHDKQGKELNKIQNIFELIVFQLDDKLEQLIYAVGQRLYNKEKNELLNNLSKCIDKRSGPRAFIRLLAMAIRNKADSNVSIGKKLLAVSLPREAVESSKTSVRGIALVTPIVDNMRYFLYIPEGKFEGEAYGPNFVCGGVVLSDFSIEKTKDGKSHLGNVNK